MAYDNGMSRKISFIIDGYYHIYNRGTDKRITFNDDQDYQRFIALLYLCNSTFAVDLREHFSEGSTFGEIFTLPRGEKIIDIGEYCLMPNHFHLILHERIEGGISLFMQKLSTGYTQYFNKRNKRTGSLFQGRFQAKHADTDEYLKYLFAYVHLNPIKLIDPEWKEKGIVDLKKSKEYLMEYPYSSYYDFLKIKRPERVILNTDAFPEYFKTERDFEEFIHDWLTYNKEFMDEKIDRESSIKVRGSIQE